MPVTAPDAISVSERPEAVKPAEISLARRRFDARVGAITDHRLSMGARCLYVLIDDYAGMRGVAWPFQTTLAERLGVSEVSIRSQCRELEAARYLTRTRTRRGVRYSLYWRPHRKQAFAATESFLSVGGPVSINEPNYGEPTPTTGERVAVDPVGEFLAEQ